MRTRSEEKCRRLEWDLVAHGLPYLMPPTDEARFADWRWTSGPAPRLIAARTPFDHVRAPRLFRAKTSLLLS